jgi:hypothetical protein
MVAIALLDTLSPCPTPTHGVDGTAYPHVILSWELELLTVSMITQPYV